MRYHGNYCGPNWSAGKEQSSIVSDVLPVDDFDQTCKQHDAAYATHNDLLAADLLFARQNFGKGGKRSAAAALVGGQAAFRAIDKFIPSFYQTKTNMSLRGAHKQQVTSHPKPGVSQKTHAPEAFHGKPVEAAAAYGTVLRGNMSSTSKLGSDSIRMNVQVCIGRPAGPLFNTRPELIATQYLAPISLGNDEVQNMCRVYQHYRITQARLLFRAFQGTAASGEVIVVADSDPNYRPVNTGVSSNFYQRALSTKHSLMTPVWCSESMDLPVDSRWKVCDNANSSTLEEFQSGVVYIYADGNTNSPGFFVVKMTIEFEGLRFNARNLISGSFLGMGTRVTILTSTTTVNAEATMTLVSAPATPGDLYSVQINTAGALFPAGVNESNYLLLSTGSGSSTAYVMNGSTLVYGRATSAGSIVLYTTYDAAIGSDNSDKLLFGQATSTQTNFPATIITQLRNSAQPSL